MYEFSKNNLQYYGRVLCAEPQAKAIMHGSADYSGLEGIVYFFALPMGVLVAADFYGLPQTKEKCSQKVFGFHIHSGSECKGTPEDPFADVQGHYNPDNCSHPFHAGDLPPIFGSCGHGFMTVLTNRFKIRDIIGRTVILHELPDDFHTQPAGNSGKKIACGIIESSAVAEG